jgi:hypothetical protein
LHGRRLLIQAGTLGEHRFTSVEYSVLTSVYPGEVGDYTAPPVEQTTECQEVAAGQFQVELPPGTEIRLKIGLARHVNEPNYSFPEM